MLEFKNVLEGMLVLGEAHRCLACGDGVRGQAYELVSVELQGVTVACYLHPWCLKEIKAGGKPQELFARFQEQIRAHKRQMRAAAKPAPEAHHAISQP